MEQLEKNNLEAQNSLMTDILSNYRSITYNITQRGDEMISTLRERKLSDDEKTITLSIENFNKLWEISRILSEERNFDQLGILAKTAVPDNETKIKILQILKK